MKQLIAACLALAVTGAAADPAAWELKGTDGNRIVLLGSVHYLRASDYPLPASIDSYYRDADRIVMEIDMDDLDPLALQQSFMRAAMLPPELRLEDVLNRALYDRALAAAETLRIDLALMSRLEPWLVANTLLDVGMMRSGFSPDRGLEQYILQRAASDGIEVDGLESVDDQIGIFDSLDMSAQEAMLEQTLADIESAGITLGEMIDAWRNGNLDSLADSLVADFAEFPGLYERLIVDRNRNWARQLEALAASGEDVLVVVGALHLTGDDSVIALLEAAGLTVERIR